MKKIRIFSLILLAAILTGTLCLGISSYAAESTAKLPEANEGQTIDVWLIAGQSNAIGQAYNSNYPTDSAYADDKALLTQGSSNVWYFGNRNTEFVPAGFGQGHAASSSGAEIGIATALNGNGKQNAIIKLAYGNTSLYNNTTSNESIKYGTWTPPSYIEAHSTNTLGNRTGDLYLSFMNKVADGIKLLTDAGYTPVIKGLWYMQGEADTFGENSSGAYAELLETLISDMRRDITDITGTDCSEMPFVYGRIHRNPNSDPTPYLTEVQAAQDKVAAKSLKNVYMINTTTDLKDPATGEHRAPVQQDAWHYDSLTQQMIGEAFVSTVGKVEGAVTKYGYIPSAYIDAASYPFAVFKRSNSYYVFDSAYNKDKYAEAMTRAITLTKSDGTALTDEAVVLLRADVDTSSFLQHTSDIGKTVTLDLGGHTLTSRTSLCNTKTDDCLAAGATKAENGTVNVKNGTLLMGNFGILYAAKNGTYTLEKTLTFNFEDLNIGFADGASTSCRTLLGIAYDSHVGDVCARYEMNFKSCKIDALTNCPTLADFKIAKLTALDESAENGYNNAVSITFLDCEIKAKSVDHLNIPMSPEGDSVTFLKGEDGTFGKVILPTGTYTNTYDGYDDGAKITLKYKSGTASGGYTTYSLIGAGDVSTPYGNIPLAYADANAYPFAVFKKINGQYEFDAAKTKIDAVMTHATALAHAKTGVTDDVVILLRRSIPSDSSFPYNVADVGGRLTLDLGGHTLNATTAIIRTDYDDDGLVGGKQKECEISIKNGNIVLCQFGVIFNTVSESAYTVEKTIDVSFESINFSFYPGTGANNSQNYKWMDLLISDRNSSSTVKAYMNIKAKDCVFDLVTNARSTAVIGTLLSANGEKGMNDISIEITGGKFITDNISKVGCLMSESGDSFKLSKDEYGNYPEILMPSSLPEPDSSYFIDTKDGAPVSACEGENVGCLYKSYDLFEGISSPYGNISYTAVTSGFAVFARNSGSDYTFINSYDNWASAFHAAASLADGSSDAYDEVVIYLTHDYVNSGVPQYASDICGTVTLDLGGNTLTVSGSFFNTWLRDGNSTTGTINVKNGKLLTTKYGLVYSAPATGSSDTYTKEKTINVNFNNVYIGFGENPASGYIYLLTHAQNGSATVNTIINMTFTDCTIDLLNNIDSTARLGRAQTNVSATKNTSTVDYKLNFKSCEFLVHGLEQLAFSSASEEGDVISYEKNSLGEYPTVKTANTVPGFSSAIHNGIDNGKATELILQYKESSSYYGIYEFVKKPDKIIASTAYADITDKYVDTVQYPFALFTKETGGAYKFTGGYATYTDAMVAAISLTSASAPDPADEVIILLRRDWTGKNFPTGTSNIATKVTVDLGGFTLGAYESLCNTGTQDTKDANGNTVKTNGTIEYKNGKLLVLVHGLIYAQKTGSYTAGYEKTLNFIFDNVYIGFAESAYAPTLIGRVAGNHTSARNTINITFNDCEIDMATNRSSKDGLLIGNWVYNASEDYTDVNMTFNGCDFIGIAQSDISFNTSSTDTTVFKTSESGGIATLTIPKSAEAPDGEYMLDGESAVFVKVSDSGENVTYRLRPKAVSEIDFTPKSSITLNSELIFNVYIPASDMLLGFTLDGEEYTVFDSLATVEIDGKSYYHLTVLLPANEAAREINLQATLEYAKDKKAEISYTVSIVKYAQKVLEDENDAEKQLVLDVLSYVRAAYAYFGTEDKEQITAIDLVLGEGYDERNAPEFDGSKEEPTRGLAGATFILNATPAIRFYIPDEANPEDYEFYIGDMRLEGSVGADSDGCYIELSVYAYLMSKTVTYMIEGNECGSYHIAGYYDFVTTDESLADNEELISLVERFAKYCESAEDYRVSVTE